MSHRVSIVAVVVLLLSALSSVPALAAPGQPAFVPSVYADGREFGTKFATEIPGPNGMNDQSYDGLFAVTNGAAGQLSIAEAGPGNPAYNGGRWLVHTVTWTELGIAAHGGSVPVLMSYDELLHQADLGYLTIDRGSPPGGPPPYFECPLLPVK